MNEPGKDQSLLRAIVDIVRQVVAMNADKAREAASERMSTLLARVCAIVIAVGASLAGLVFLSVGVGQLLAQTAVGQWAWVIIGGVYLLVAAIVLLVQSRRAARRRQVKAMEQAETAGYVDLMLAIVKLWQNFKKND